MILPVPRITQSTKRSNTSSQAKTLHSSHPLLPTVVTDTEDRRGENDASDLDQASSGRANVSQRRGHATWSTADADDPDMPAVRSTDDTFLHWQLPQRTSRKSSLLKTMVYLQNKNNTSQHDEITQVSQADNTPFNVTAGSN